MSDIDNLALQPGLRRPLKIVWLFYSISIFTVLLLSFLLTADTISGLLPACEWKLKYDRPCPFCGMTTSFLLISRGKYTDAYAANSLSVWLYPLFALNTVLFIYELGKEFIRGFKKHYEKKEGINL